ncbi:MAG: NADH-quinone oxidoreductase subunit M [Helicobacteraceae bacterium]|nr:NADH-quinone oxidoreductase subunit M [Helicobacteraceae bacterium]
MQNLLSLIIFLPISAVVLMGLFQVSLKVLRVISLATSVLVFLLVSYLGLNFDPLQSMQFVEVLPWIESYGINYFVGVDAISYILLFLVSLFIPMLFVFIWDEDRKGFFYNLLLLQTGVMGTLLSLDLILFYLFWEMMLLPIFIMIGAYGYGLRQANAMKIIMMTVLGSMTMLFSILYLGYLFFEDNGFWSFSLFGLSSMSFSSDISIILAAGFLLAFSIKIPLVGFHTWMAPAYSSAPTPALVILSAIMAKLGIYGLWRFGFTLFEGPLSYYAPLTITLSIVGILFYAIHAIMEKDLKRMFAFSSASHLSLITLGLFSINIYSWSGSLYLVATHAISSAGIFLLIGMIGKRIKSIKISDLGGIATVAPKFAFFFAFFALSIAGIPGTGGFVAELLIIMGAFKYSFWVGVFAATTMISAILFIFWMLQRTIYGKVSQKVADGFYELSRVELLLLLPLMLLLVLTGIFPSFFISFFEPTLGMMLFQIGDIS